jgi:Right handed beta helix region
MFVLSPSFSILSQGLLTPPGVPAPTMKTLDQIEPRTPISSLPYTISAAGSYYVTGNLTGVAGSNGITVTADHVTLDLGGFALVGPGGSSVHVGVLISSPLGNVTIRNGTVRGWPSYGVAAFGENFLEIYVEKVRAFQNTSGGISVGNYGTIKGCEVHANGGSGINGQTGCKVIECTATGQTGTGGGISLFRHGVVTACLARDNAGDGIRVGTGSSVTGCTSASNGGDGFALGSNCVARDCAASSNGGEGFGGNGTPQQTLTNCAAASNGTSGFVCGTSSVLENCSASGNPVNGFTLANGCTLSRGTASSNSTAGLVAGNGCTISDSSAYSNGGDGFTVGESCTVRHCTSYSNANVGDGFEIGEGTSVEDCRANSNRGSGILGTASGTPATITGCTVYSNDAHGIAIGAGVISRCDVSANGLDGIRVIGSCRITENKCDSNGTASVSGRGIHVITSNCTIQNNSMTSNDTGLFVEGAPNVITGNSARANLSGGNYSILAGNMTGTILTSVAAMNAAANNYGNLSF